MKITYPVLFTETSNGYLVEVPDLNVYTEGETIQDAISMARDIISVTIVSMEEHNDVIPVPSSPQNIDAKNGTFANEGNSFLSIVDVDITEYRKMVDTKPVRRNVSLPSWLNYEAERSGINVSGVLQDALISVLGLQNKYATK